jgi:predicted membrane-bound spermidine synthase
VRSFSSILAAPMAAPNKNDRYFLHGHLQYSTKDQKENLHYPRDLIAWTETRRVV